MSQNWIINIKETIKPKTSNFKNGQFDLKWESIAAKSCDYNKKIASVKDVLAETYTEMELEFAKKYPNEVPSQMFLKSLTPLFQNENVDWNKAKSELKNTFISFFETTDFAMFSQENDIHIFVEAKQESKTIGIIQFTISDKMKYGEVKAGLFSYGENIELGKALMNSIFILVPEVSQIFLDTRSTNIKLIENYTSWGFKETESTAKYWTNMEYTKK